MTVRCGGSLRNRVVIEDKIQHNKKGRLASAPSSAVRGNGMTWWETKELTRRPSLGNDADQDEADSHLLWSKHNLNLMTYKTIAKEYLLCLLLPCHPMKY